MKYLNRSLVISILFVMTGVGVTFAAGNNSTQNFLLGGNTGLTANDLNTALTLLVGPQGPAGAKGATGAAGVAGATGATGAAGAAGATGATGATGKDGASVVTAILPVGDANCVTGGLSVTSGTTVQYVCNGKQGAAGATGATGATGAAGAAGTGGGGGTSTGYGAGTLSAGACDDSVEVQLKNTFSGGKFALNQILMNNVKAACDNKVLKVYFTIRTTGALYGDGYSSSKYTNSNEIVCQKTLTGTSWSGTGDNRQMTIESTDNCTVTGGATLTLAEISARDIQDNVGFEIG